MLWLNIATSNILVTLIMAILQFRTVNLTKLVCWLPLVSKAESRYRRLQRFFWNVSFDEKMLALFLTSFLWKWSYMLSMDRTNRQYWKTNINILTLGIVHNWIAIPVLWTLLDKKWCSDTDERIAIIQRFLAIFWKWSIDILLADREFIGAKRIEWLLEEKVPFIIRVRNNTKVCWFWEIKHIYKLFEKDRMYTPKHFAKRRIIRWIKLYISWMKVDWEYLIVISNHANSDHIVKYWQRRSIETLFWNFKSKWFSLEDTHLQKPERISTMIGVLAICTMRAHRVWERRNEQKRIIVKNHNRRQFSIFRYWLDYLRDIIQHISSNIALFIHSLQFLYCT